MSALFPSSLSGIEAASLTGAALLLLAAAAQDVIKFRISNWFSVALVALFPVFALASHSPPLGHLVTGVCVFGCGFGLYACGLLGGGDVKLLAATSLWAGPGHILNMLVIVAFFGGMLAAVYAVIALIRAKKAKNAESPKDGVVPWHKAPVPYGMAIACGGWMVLFKLARGTIA